MRFFSVVDRAKVIRFSIKVDIQTSKFKSTSFESLKLNQFWQYTVNYSVFESKEFKVKLETRLSELYLMTQLKSNCFLDCKSKLDFHFFNKPKSSPVHRSMDHHRNDLVALVIWPDLADVLTMILFSKVQVINS